MCVAVREHSRGRVALPCAPRSRGSRGASLNAGPDAERCCLLPFGQHASQCRECGRREDEHGRTEITPCSAGRLASSSRRLRLRLAESWPSPGPHRCSHAPAKHPVQLTSRNNTSGQKEGKSGFVEPAHRHDSRIVGIACTRKPNPSRTLQAGRSQTQKFEPTVFRGTNSQPCGRVSVQVPAQHRRHGKRVLWHQQPRSLPDVLPT